MINVYYAYKRREEAHPMLFYALEKFYAVKADETDLEFSKNGKLYIAKTALYFNITHTDGLIMIAISDSPVGIDAENVFKKIDAEKIADKYFSAEEREQIENQKHFFILWTKKESAIKYADLTLASALSKTSFKGNSPTGFTAYEGASTLSYAFDDYVYSLTAKDTEHRLIYII